MFQSKSTKATLVTVAIVLLLFFLHYTKILRPFENLAAGAIKPVLNLTYSLSNKVGSTYLEFRDKGELKQENEEFRNQIAKLLQEKSVWQEEKQENQFLRDQLSFVKDNNYAFEIANVIGRGLDEVSNILIVDKGEKNGVSLGQAVVSGSGVMIGKITKVEKNRAFVLLLNDDLSQVATKIQNEDKTMGLVVGQFGLGLIMNYIPTTESVEVDDLVVSSGVEEMVPQGLVVGQIDNVVSVAEDLFQSATIRSLIDFNKITLVNILKVSP